MLTRTSYQEGSSVANFLRNRLLWVFPYYSSSPGKILGKETKKDSTPVFSYVLCNSSLTLNPFFYVLLTVHLGITLANDKFEAQIFSTFITILYMYMFRAIPCSSSGDQIVLIQHLVSSLSVSDRPVYVCSKHVHVENCNKCTKNLCIKLVIG
jgi:hypothetical protein